MSQNWIDEVLSELDHVETPRAWLYWSLLCSISAAMGNNYFLVTYKGAAIFKANLYVILLGESGLGKEFPISLARELVSKADVTRVIAGRSSIQAIVKELSLARTREKKPPLEGSRGFIVNGELSTAVIQDPDSLTILTDLYDNKSSWVNLLKGDGAEKLKHPYITCLFGSSPAHFYESIPQVNMEGGYIGRNFIIEETKRHKDLDMLDDDTLTEFPYGKYSPYLELINSKGGRVIPDTDSKDLFNNWRRRWREEAKSDKTGFINRVPAHVLKTAMILSVSDEDSKLVINQGHIEEAIERVSGLVYTTKKSSEGKGADPLAAQTKLVLDLLLAAENNELKRKQLLNKGYGNYDSIMLDRILDTLDQHGWIKKERLVAGRNSDWIIQLSGEPLAQYRKFIEGRKKK